MPHLFSPFLMIVVLCVLSAISLLTQHEAARGLGRIADGAAWIVASFLLPPLGGASFLPYVLTATGIVTVLAGMRKFYRAFDTPI